MHQRDGATVTAAGPSVTCENTISCLRLATACKLLARDEHCARARPSDSRSGKAERHACENTLSCLRAATACMLLTSFEQCASARLNDSQGGRAKHHM